MPNFKVSRRNWLYWPSKDSIFFYRIILEEYSQSDTFHCLNKFSDGIWRGWRCHCSNQNGQRIGCVKKTFLKIPLKFLFFFFLFFSFFYHLFSVLHYFVSDARAFPGRPGRPARYALGYKDVTWMFTSWANATISYDDAIFLARHEQIEPMFSCFNVRPF